MSVLTISLQSLALLLVPLLFSLGFLRSSRRCCSTLSDRRFFARNEETISQDLVLLVLGLLPFMWMA